MKKTCQTKSTKNYFTIAGYPVFDVWFLRLKCVHRARYVAPIRAKKSGFFPNGWRSNKTIPADHDRPPVDSGYISSQQFSHCPHSLSIIYLWCFVYGSRKVIISKYRHFTLNDCPSPLLLLFCSLFFLLYISRRDLNRFVARTTAI